MNTRTLRILRITLAAVAAGVACLGLGSCGKKPGGAGDEGGAAAASQSAPARPARDVMEALFHGEFGDPRDQAVGAARALYDDTVFLDPIKLKSTFEFDVRVYCVPGSKLTRQQIRERFGEGDHPPYTVAMPDTASLKSEVVKTVPADAVLHYGRTSLAFDKTGCLRAIVRLDRRLAADAPADRRERAEVTTDVTFYPPGPSADSDEKEKPSLERWVLESDMMRREDNPKPKWVLPLPGALATAAPPVSRRVLQRPALRDPASAKTARPAPPQAKGKTEPPPASLTDPTAALKALAAGDLTRQDDPAAEAARVLLAMLAGRDAQAGHAIVVPAETLTFTYDDAVKRFGRSDVSHRSVQMHERISTALHDAPGDSGGRRRLDQERRPDGFQGTPARANLHYGPLTLAFDQDNKLHTLVWVNAMPEADAAGHAKESVVIVKAVTDGKPDVGIDSHASPHWLIAQ